LYIGHMDKSGVRKKHIKITLLSLMMLSILAAIALFVINMNSPAVGTVSDTAPQDPPKKQAAAPGRYSDSYISFSYPAAFKINPSQKGANYLSVVSLVNTDHSGKYIAISVVRESLANDSGLNHRKSHPETYRLESSSSDRAVFTSAQNGSEKTGYIAHGGLVASVSITSAGVKDLNTDFGHIVNSLQWKQ